MKKIVLIFSLFLGSLSFSLWADNISRDGYGGSPTSILHAVVEKANQDYKIQDTKLDGVTSQAAGYSGKLGYRLTNTLYYVKDNIHPYLQWILYIGLALATILLIYNGFLMVTNVTHGQGEFSKIKGNLLSIALGVIILTGFYYLIDIILAVLNFIFT